MSIYGIQGGIEYTNPGSYIWNKPKDIVMVYIFLQAAGGGGGAGSSGVAGTNRNGGGGGGSGGMTTLLIPALFLPDILYITVGRGAAGQPTTATAVDSPLATAVRFHPTGSFICTANSGGSANGAVGGTGPSSVTSTNMPVGVSGIWTSYAGQSGQAASGTGGDGTGSSLFFNTYQPTAPSGGGVTTANVSGLGGSVSSAGLNIFSAPGGSTAGAEGSAGVAYKAGMYPWYHTPGTGGAGNAAGTGGIGGSAIRGAGGGGGGGGITGGRGGNGGSGYVFIQCI